MGPFLATHPGVELTLFDANSVQGEEAIVAREIDLGEYSPFEGPLRAPPRKFTSRLFCEVGAPRALTAGRGLDGPTNHLDLESIQALNDAIEKFEGTVVLSSHDVRFVDSLVTRVIEFAGEKTYDLGMGYEQYLADEDRRARVAAAAR